MRLSLLDPVLFLTHDTNAYSLTALDLDKYYAHEADGLQFNCPKCRNHRLIILTESVPDDSWPEIEDRWEIEGNDLEHVTVIGNIAGAVCGWEGSITDGEVSGQ